MAQSKHLDPLKQCPLLGVERTLAEYSEMSAYDPKRTSTRRSTGATRQSLGVHAQIRLHFGEK